MPHFGIVVFSVRGTLPATQRSHGVVLTSAGQSTQWKAHHRSLCKRFNRYIVSAGLQSLAPDEKVDAILLSQLLASIFPSNTFDSPQEVGAQLTSIFLELMQRPLEELSIPPVCVPSNPPPQIVGDLFTRFSNNNFVLHSHLTPFAHGIFPLASRLFNHSCVPNCVAKYIITPGEAVRMEVVALRAINEGEEARCLLYRSLTYCLHH